MKREFNLIEYLPPFMQSYKELISEYKAIEPELEDICSAQADILDNSFIKTADEDGISKFENLLGIVPSVSDSLETRRENVKAMWNYNAVYTMGWFEQWLKEFTSTECGPRVDGYSLFFSLPIKSSWQRILSEVEQIVPMNLSINPTLKPCTGSSGVYPALAYRYAARVTHETEQLGLSNICVLTDENGDVLCEDDKSVLFEEET